MNYEIATNYMLNARLAELIGMKVADVDDAPFNFSFDNVTPLERYNNYRERYPDTVWCLKDGEPWEQYVFTSDWNQTMPLAVEHKIYHQECNGLWDCGYSSGGGMFATQTHYVASDKNPLRAIVICLIKVLERKK